MEGHKHKQQKQHKDNRDHDKKPLNKHQMQVLDIKMKKQKLLQKVRYNDVDRLKQSIKRETPPPGEYLYDFKLEKAEEEREKLQPEEFRRKYKINFGDLPISNNTIVGLQKRKFVKMTEIQRCTLPHILAGRDVLAASKTGSGKTLAYLVPLVERLYVQKWNPLDGLGALVILPTRELATQVFEVFNSFTVNHDLSVGLIIGGKNLKYEKDHMKGMNILICTPGRLLQHMDETPDFDCSNLQMIVLDEADLILEFGFQEALNAILYNLPASRQTILFSATLSKSIHELAKLQLKSPEYIFLHEVRTKEQQDKASLKDIYEAPVKLTQFYMEVKTEEKLNMLFSFLRSHKKNKVLVFLSTCKQVRFVYESFRRLKLGPPVFELHGRQKQAKRMAIFFTYAEKKFGVLFTTNIAARGLDFPSVEWIVQVDCPEDDVTYLHRVGRTARYKADGNAILMLLPSEIKMIDKLKERKLQLNKLKANPEHQLSITNTLQSFLVESVDLKYLAQRAFISYVRSIFFAKDKEIFDVSKIDVDGLAESFGLIQTPVINFKGQKGADDESEEDEDDDDKQIDDQEEEQEDDLVNRKKAKLEKLKEKIKKLKEEKAKKLKGIISVEGEGEATEKRKENQEKQQKKDKKIKQNKESNEELEETNELKQKETKKKEKKTKQIKDAQEEGNEKEEKTKKKVSKEKDIIEEEDVEEVEEEQQEKIELKKKNKIQNVKHEKLVKRKNQDVFSENFKKLRAEKDDDSEDDFLVKKKKVEESEGAEDSSLKKFSTLKVSKNQLKKIKEGGYFDGKNITYFTDEGKSLTSEQQRLLKYKENEKIHEEEGEDRSKKFAMKLETNKEADNENERKRRKEIRDKKKMKDYEKVAVIAQRNQQMLATLGEEEEDEEVEEQNEDQDVEQDNIEEEEEEEIKPPSKKQSKGKKHHK